MLLFNCAAAVFYSTPPTTDYCFYIRPLLLNEMYIYIYTVLFSLEQEDVMRNEVIKERERRETETRILKEARSVDVAKDLPPR